MYIQRERVGRGREGEYECMYVLCAYMVIKFRLKYFW